MKRQRSILSFLQKPQPPNQNPNTIHGELLHHSPFKQQQQQQQQTSSHFKKSTLPTSSNPSPPETIKGTDTPPEKLSRQIFPSKLNGDTRPSLFSSIMHKFAKGDDRAVSAERNQEDCDSFNSCLTSNKINTSQEISKKETPSRRPQEGKISELSNYDKGFVFNIDEISDNLGPETPASRPRWKRFQGEIPLINLDDKEDSPLPNSISKRAKLVHDFGTESKKHDVVSETNSSKFEWLRPSLIKDANRRCPGDVLYDKRTLFIPPDDFKKMSASQKQYWSVKCQYMDILLFFKMGKFYELYEKDAEIGHKELDWKITFSGVGKCKQVGISESGIDDAVQKLTARGYKVGRIEQTETSDQAKARGGTSVIQRKLVHVVTPSTITDGNIGPDAVHLLALKEFDTFRDQGNQASENGSVVYGFAFVDCASLRFWVGSISDDASCAALGALLMQVSPKEIVYESRGLSREAHKALKKYSSAGSTMLQLPPTLAVTDFVDASKVRELIHSRGYFKKSFNSPGFALEGVMDDEHTLCALGGLVTHLSRLMLDDVLCNGEISPYQVYKGCLRMDGQTLVNLEIFGNNADGGPEGTLYKYLDSCVTSSGKRLLRSWICHPLKGVDEINDRLNVVEELIKHSEISLLVAQSLRKLPDIERLLGRVKACLGSSDSLLLPLIGKKVLKQRVKTFGNLVKGLRNGIDLLILLQKDKHLISSLTKLLNIPLLSGSTGLDKHLTQFEAAVDSDFPNFQDHDVSDSDAETLSVLIELFVEDAMQWSQVIQALNCIDVLRSFAVTANSTCGSMCRPILMPADRRSSLSCQEAGGPILRINGLWHPYAFGENGGAVVPNDVNLGEDTTGYCPRTLLLTGPNMGGKSTLLRATCLSAILAQLGCYVPCEMCVLTPVDIIFTRLGSTDRIMTGESTFFIECMETASVLRNATSDSLVLLDELGRGTSTYDGYAIAYAVFRHLVEKVYCRLLFATHYHSLTKEFASHPHVTLQHMACAFKTKPGNSFEGTSQELVFLYRLTSGACPESYGLQVATMAGIPKKVVEVALTASEVMKESIGGNFKSSEQRSEFSTLHEEWLRTLSAVSNMGESILDDDDDAFDTLLCLWHELKSFYASGNWTV
ncbi:hypothetical protein GIB67_035414 [Kingdonia uniflora]|uniref:DNA mismatch repair protein n=1 Tax=Kingdonia uniflora TaxID=39325 RepID=A0A7J7P0L0_9MAGN|nr:hypothetical protein GIB67_035414 [Kingdonia uniflora]